MTITDYQNEYKRKYQNEYLTLSARKLNSITILATDISAEECLEDWVDGVALAGTFIKTAPMTLWSIGASGVPNNWAIVDYEDYENYEVSKFARPA